MVFEDFMVFFRALEFLSEISGTFSVMLYVVVEPLMHNREGECAAKAIFIVFLGGGAPESTTRGRGTTRKTRAFDSTMGLLPWRGRDRATIMITLALKLSNPLY